MADTGGESDVVAATFKILVLGDSNVGKSSLIQSYCTRKKPVAMMHTIGEHLELEVWLFS